MTVSDDLLEQFLKGVSVNALAEGLTSTAALNPGATHAEAVAVVENLLRMQMLYRMEKMLQNVQGLSDEVDDVIEMCQKLRGTG